MTTVTERVIQAEVRSAVYLKQLIIHWLLMECVWAKRRLNPGIYRSDNQIIQHSYRESFTRSSGYDASPRACVRIKHADGEKDSRMNPWQVRHAFCSSFKGAN